MHTNNGLFPDSMSVCCNPAIQGEGMIGHAAGTSDENGVGQLLRKFLDEQHRRAAAYNRLRRAFADLQKTGAEAPYQVVCTEVTQSFSECSKQVLEIEAALKEPNVNRPDLAEILHDVQSQEKEKLHMTVTLQLLRKAGRPSERTSEQPSDDFESSLFRTECADRPESESKVDKTGLEVAKLEAEYEAAIKEVTGVLQNAIVAINEHIEEVRYELDELEERKESSQSCGRRVKSERKCEVGIQE